MAKVAINGFGRIGKRAMLSAMNLTSDDLDLEDMLEPVSDTHVRLSGWHDYSTPHVEAKPKLVHVTSPKEFGQAYVNSRKHHKKRK